MSTEKKQKTNRRFEAISLDWSIVNVDSRGDTITITAERHADPGSDTSKGYSYRAHLKWNPKSTWEKNIPKDARDWEVKQRTTPLWETARGDDFNYTTEPWKHRPPIMRLTEKLNEQGATDIADRIKEAYNLTR